MNMMKETLSVGVRLDRRGGGRGRTGGLGAGGEGGDEYGDGDVKEIGIFQPPDGLRPGRWLRLDKTLTYYDLKNNVPSAWPCCMAFGS